MITISPERFGIESECRIVIFDLLSKKFDRLIVVNSDTVYKIEDSYILNNIADYKFKLQIKSSDKWIDATKYLKFYDDKILNNLFNYNKKIDYNEYKKILENYWHSYSVNHNQEIKTAFANSMRKLWNNPLDDFTNLTTMLAISKDTKVQIPLLWKNIILYINEILTLNEIHKELAISEFSFKSLNNGNRITNAKLVEHINIRISLLENKDLEFSNLLIGLYHSYLGDRDLAAEYFNQAHCYNEHFIEEMKIDLGSFTYDKLVNDTSFIPEITYYNTRKNENNLPTILLSMDPKFLEYYGVQLFYSIIVLNKYHFHLHIVENDTDINDTIQQAQDIFKNITSFMKPKKPIISPTFSSEKCPTFVKNKKTYYACSRYIVSKDIIKKFDANIFIMDVDFFINDELDTYFSEMAKYDIVIPFSKALQSLFPWRRIMAGFVYVNKREEGKTFLEYVNNYILNNLNKENSWTLDQNALSYAYEKIYNYYPEIKIGDSRDFELPMEQPPLRKLIEKL